MLSCRLRVSSLNQPSTRAVVFVPDHTTRGRGRLGLEGELAAGIYCEASCKLYPGPVAQRIAHWFPKPGRRVHRRSPLALFRDLDGGIRRGLSEFPTMLAKAPVPTRIAVST